LDSKKRRFIEETLDIKLLESETKYNAFEKIDAYVDYDLQIATKSYENGLYPVTILFCAIALEEQLSAIYKMKTKGDRSKLYKCKGKIAETDDMNLNCLIEWAKSEGIIKDQVRELIAIRFARNFFGHATRIMLKKTTRELENGRLEEILPSEREFPDWFSEMKEYHESITGEKIETSKPVIGWLDSKETAANVFRVTVDFIEESSKILYLANHYKIH